MLSEFDLSDYVKMQNEIYMSGSDGGPSIPVIIYGDDGEQVMLNVWYDPADQALIDQCAVEREKPFFVKAYSGHTGRVGVNIQTGVTVDFTGLGYGPNSTIALRRLIALNANGWTLQYLQDKGVDVFPRNDNHLDLRRDNIVVGRIIHEWGEERREEYSLARAKHQLEKENTHEETEIS